MPIYIFWEITTYYYYSVVSSLPEIDVVSVARSFFNASVLTVT